MLPLVGLRR